MAILIDVSQIIIANVSQAQYKATREQVTVDDLFVKHMIINSLRLYNHKFKSEYGEMIICCDSKDTWRKKQFPFYKAHRQEQKEAGPIEWNLVYSALNGMVKDLKEYFPYKVMKVESCEADDIIAKLSRDLHGNHVIVSGDKDMGQLTNQRVKQFHPITKKFIDIPNSQAFLKDLIIRGDKGDGVPNILSDSDTFITKGKRSKSIHDEKVNVWLNQAPEFFCENSRVLENYHKRNTVLIDLTQTPEDIQNSIMEAYRVPANGNRQTIMQYFMANRMRSLLECIEQF